VMSCVSAVGGVPADTGRQQVARLKSSSVFLMAGAQREEGVWNT
jgi:hypothetical protein